jgi:type IX secretion system PorP/SprF family membrane protein
MRSRLLLLTFTFAALSSSAQQTGHMSHVFLKPALFNPGFTGHQDRTQAFLATRAQFTGFRNAPHLTMFQLDGAIRDQKMAIGLQLFNDRKGLSNALGAKLAYAYRLKIGEDVVITPGLSFGVTDQSINFAGAELQDYNDPAVLQREQHRVALDANAGIAATWKDLQLGFAVPQLLGMKLNYSDSVSEGTGYRMSRHFMGHLRYDYYINREKGLGISPQAIVRIVPGAPLQYDGNLNFFWKDKFWIGATYKSNYAVAANAGVNIGKVLAIGYSYDFITAEIGSYAGMSHELMLSFTFGNRKKEGPVEMMSPLTITDTQVADSLETELRKEQARVKALTEQLEQMKKQQATPQQNQGGGAQQQGTPQQHTPQPANGTNENQSMQTTGPASNRTVENGVLTVTESTPKFKDDNGVSPEKGYYVVVGTFRYRDFAEAEAKRYFNRGYKAANVVYYGPYEYNYVFMYHVKTKEEALKRVKEAWDSGVKDAWILSLPE